MDLLISKIYGKHIILPKIKVNKAVKGLGFSDFYLYAQQLEAKFDYSNTYYHKEPKLDILNIPETEYNKYDFVVNSEILEHIHQPVQKAFDNFYRLLKPGGILVFTVPYDLVEETIEHFPSLHDYTIEEENGQYLLTNTTRDGKIERFDNLTFHGGQGATLELRVFCKNHIERLLMQAGFKDIEFRNRNVYRFGIVWKTKKSLPIFARKPSA